MKTKTTGSPDRYDARDVATPMGASLSTGYTAGGPGNETYKTGFWS